MTRRAYVLLVAGALTTASLAACSGAHHDSGSPGSSCTVSSDTSLAASRGTGNPASNGSTTIGGGPDNSALFTPGTIPPGSVAHPGPTTTAPSQSAWVQEHAAALRLLKTALSDVSIAFTKSDNTALTNSLITCSNAAAPLNRTAAASLPRAQSDALATIAQQCPAIVHLLKSGDAAGVKDAHAALDAATAAFAPTFTAAGA